MKELESSNIAAGDVKWYNYYAKQFGSSSISQTIIWQQNSYTYTNSYLYISPNWKHVLKYSYTNVHSSPINNSQMEETNQMSINKW